MKLLRSTRGVLSLLSVLVLSLMLLGSASADSKTYTGSSGNLSAGATFSLTGNTLTVTLTNTSNADVLVPTDVLTAVWFNVTSALTPGSAGLNGSSVYYGSISNDGNGWGYYSGLNGGAHGMNDGITSAGFSIGGGHANFGNGSALQGLDYGLLSHGDNSGTGNTGVTGHGPLAKNCGVFTLTVANGFNLSQLGNYVIFQYGTSLSDGSFSGFVRQVPEPSALTMLFSGLVSGGVLLRRKMKA